MWRIRKNDRVYRKQRAINVKEIYLDDQIKLNQYTSITHSALSTQTLTKLFIWVDDLYNTANRAMRFHQPGRRDSRGMRLRLPGTKVLKRRRLTARSPAMNATCAGDTADSRLDMLNSRNALRTLLWDHLEPTAAPRPSRRTLPLLWRRLQQECDGGVRRAGNVAAAYDYSPYGRAASTGDLVQPVQWSAEMHDDDLAWFIILPLLQPQRRQVDQSRSHR